MVPPENTPEYASENTPEYASENTPEYASENTPENTPENTHRMAADDAVPTPAPTPPGDRPGSDAAKGTYHWLDVLFKDVAPGLLPDLLRLAGLDASGVLGQPDIPEPHLESAEMRPQPPLGDRDFVKELVGAAGVQFLILEFQAQHDADIDGRIADYVNDLRFQGKVPIVALVLYLDDGAAGPARKGKGGVQVARVSTGMAAGLEAQITQYYWVNLKRALPPLESATPELAPLFAMLLHKQRGERLEKAARQQAAKVIELVRPLDSERRWAVLNSFAQVLTNRNPRLAETIWELFKMAYLSDPKKSLLFRDGKVEGKAEGKAEEARRILLKLGEHQFGEAAPDRIATAIAGINDVEHLELLIDRIIGGEARSWADLLA